LSREPQIEGCEARPLARVPSGKWRPVSVCAAIAIDISSDQQVEGSAAVGAKDRRESETRTPNYRIGDEFMPLIEGGKRPLQSRVRLIHGAEVAVVVRHIINSLAIGVVSGQRKRAVETLREFENSSVVDGRSSGFV